MHDNQFTVNVKELEKGPTTLQVHCAPEDLELGDPEFKFSDVNGEVTFSLVRPRVVAIGTLNTQAVTQCVRCLGDAVLKISAPVHATYEDEKHVRDTRNEVVSPEEQIITPFNGDWIQPEPELLEAIMLELPTLPLCSDDCKGLCDKCGANLNEGPCNCAGEQEDVSPWKSALKDLKLK